MRLVINKISTSRAARPVWAVAVKDLKSLFNNPTGWLLVVVFDVIVLWLFMQSYFLIGQVELESLFVIVQWGLMILAGALGAKSFAEERHKKTLELLSSLPLPTRQLVWAKVLAGMVVFGLVTLTLIPSVVVIASTGQLDWGQTFSAWLGSFLWFTFFYSLGSYLSLFVQNVVVGFLLDLFAFFGFYVATSSFVLDRLPPQVASVVSAFSLEAYYQSFTNGVPSLGALVFMLSFILLWIELSVSRLNYQDNLL